MTTESPSIFTKIINREIPATIVYEDATTIAFLTIEPFNPGHTLIVPKVPFENIFDGDEIALGQMMAVAKRISIALVQAGLADGVNLIMNNGPAAKQEVFHAHLHVVPRRTGDGIFNDSKHIVYQPDGAAATAALIQAHLD